VVTDDVLSELEELERAKYRDRLVPRTCDDRTRPPIEDILRDVSISRATRCRRILEAHSHGYRFAEIAQALNVHPSTPGVIVRRFRSRSLAESST
jgi:DNA-binding NarL/FixJ family response regulator